MTTIEIVLAIAGAFGGIELVKWLYRVIFNRHNEQTINKAEAAKAKASAVSEEWQTLRDQIGLMNGQVEAMQKQVEFKDRRIEDLNNDIAEKEERFKSQTDRLRETQDREHKTILELQASQREVQKLTEAVAERDLALANHRCILEACCHREPQNHHSRKACELAKKAKPKKGTLPKSKPEEKNNSQLITEN